MAGAHFYGKLMEEAEVPLEHLHEHIHHHAEHGGVSWISGVALSTAILAVLAAIAGLLSGKHANEAMMSQIQASDQWAYYQAKSIKASVLDAKMTLTATATDKDKEKAAQYQEEQAEIKREAEHKQAEAKSQLSQARSFGAERDDVSNRHCDRGDFCANQETPLLVGEPGLWPGRRCLSRAGFDSPLN